ncbi:MAG: membrane protein insertion efficiency factor YidD [Salinibacter sp.]|uniref:membrane protein insertion efficiency factor YidD n=1 Tax=Salinibacter sp. TaxID=2065818 RepID=UPI0035D441C2
MRDLLLFAIRCYWRFFPEKWRGQCIFRITCSHHVYETTRTRGARAGMRALIDRLRKCRPGYTVYSEGNVLRVRLADGSSIDESEAASHVLAPYRDAAERLQASLNGRDDPGPSAATPQTATARR